MIPYYSPNINLKSIINFFINRNSQNNIISSFKNYTKKIYILLTHSCRSSLYLAYNALGKTGEVITSPLTCMEALLPIVYSKYIPIFVDVKKDTLNIDTSKIEDKITKDTVAIQVIHFGGNPVEMDQILQIAKKYNLVIIEDCAQSYGAKYSNNNVGSFGDISCFSLSKNLFGIAGGVLATDNYQFFKTAERIQNNFLNSTNTFLYYRLVRKWLESHLNNSFAKLLYNKIVNIRNLISENNDDDNVFFSLQNYLKKPHDNLFNLSKYQLSRIKHLNKRRVHIARILIDKLKGIGSLKFQNIRQEDKHSFCKLYIYSELFNNKDLYFLNQNGIEAKHLEHTFHATYQIPLFNNNLFKNYSSLSDCTVYSAIHDKVISIPLYEDMPTDQIVHICSIFKQLFSQRF